MFSLSELAPLDQHQSRSKLLKPWWEIFMDYTVVLMLMVSLLASTVQLSRDKVVCIPLDALASTNSSVVSSNSVASRVPTRMPPEIGPDLSLTASGRRTHLVSQQYVYISQVCYHEALPLSSRFFSYAALLLSLMLMASGSFWLHFPHTSARVEHFLAILAKCCESPWTSQALTRAAQQDNLKKKTKEEGSPPSCSLPLRGLTRRLRAESDAYRPLMECPSPGPSRHPFDTPSSRIFSSSVSFTSSDTQHPRLDKSDEEEVRMLFERVRKFRSHCESSDVIYKVYLAQTVFKLLMVTLIMSSTIPLLGSFSFTYLCHPESQTLVGYAAFQCIHVLSSLLHKLMLTYLALLGLYDLLNLYALGWIGRNTLRHYPVHLLSSLRDTPDLRNDLAFLLHMLDQYDPLLVQRLAIFLSPVTEKGLPDRGLEGHWGELKLRAMIRSDLEGRSCLQLIALPQLPLALFTLSHLQVLKLELITEARFTMQVSNMTSLRELHLCYCTAAVESSALGVLQERLEVLHVTFSHTSEIPSWVLSLRSLCELHLSGRLGHSWPLGSLRCLRHLRVLVIHGMLQRIPGELCEVAGSLVKLEVHNEGSRLLALSGLKRMVALTELQLQGCLLERLPTALQALPNLQALDMHNNRLRTLEELSRRAYLPRLSCLRLSDNNIATLPASIGELQGLELLDLSNNQLQNVPLALFSLCRLRKLLLGGNLLENLPAEVKALQHLIELDVSGNRLESLPPELFSSCVRLCLLNVSHNALRSLPVGMSSLSELCMLDLRENNLHELPAELGSCSGLRRGGLLVEYGLFLSLPPHVRHSLRHICSSSSSESDLEEFLNSSPSHWRFSSAPESQI